MIAGCLALAALLPSTEARGQQRRLPPTIVDSPTARLPAPTLTVLESSAGGPTIGFRPRIRLRERLLAGRRYDTIEMRGARYAHREGRPMMPYLTRLIALPEGATVTARLVDVQRIRLENRRVRPADAPSEDDESPPRPLREDPEVYRSDSLYPPQPVTIHPGPKLGDVETAVVRVYPAQFRPATGELTVIRSLRFRLELSRPFSRQRRQAVRTPYQASIGGGLLNRADLDLGSWRRSGPGPEMLIISAPELEAAAEPLAVWRRQRGLATRHVTTEDTGATREAIAAYVRDLYEEKDSRLGYVLFVGDVDRIPTFYELSDKAEPGDEPTIATDLTYFQLDPSGDFLPDLAHGRLTASDAAEVAVVVDKILAYEKTPPSAADYFDTLVFAGYFQDDLTQAEAVLSGLRYTSQEFGGNDITVTHREPASDPATRGGFVAMRPASVSVTVRRGTPVLVQPHTAISVVLGTGPTGSLSTRRRELMNLLNDDPEVAALVSVSLALDADDDGVEEYTELGAVEAVDKTWLEGGSLRDGGEDKSYIYTLEGIREGLLATTGKTVVREYTTNSTDENGNPDGPQSLAWGHPMDPDLLMENGFAWDADTDSVTAEINAGRALLLHRDHGSSDGWAHPRLKRKHVPDLDNAAALPVMFSLNCGSGRFDNETDGDGDAEDAFAEQILVRPGGGVVSIVAATRASSTSRNDQYAWGLMDALFGAVDPYFGDTQAGIDSRPSRLGDVLNYAKAYVVSQFEPDDAYTQKQIRLYHVLGDPALEIWTEEPKDLNPVVTERADWTQVDLEMAVGDGLPHAAIWRDDELLEEGELINDVEIPGERRSLTFRFERTTDSPGRAMSLHVNASGYLPFSQRLSKAPPLLERTVP